MWEESSWDHGARERARPAGPASTALGAVAQPAWAHKGHQQPHHNLRGQVLTTAVAAPFGLAVGRKKASSRSRRHGRYKDDDAGEDDRVEAGL